jgi:excisionase family DNA binding protein
MGKTQVLEQLLTQPEAAAICGVHLQTIIRARRAGELRWIKRGRSVRIRPSDLAAWLEAQTVGGDF